MKCSRWYQMSSLEAILAKAGITHVVSLLNIPRSTIGEEANVKQLKIEVDDVEEEDLISHFGTIITFISDALESNGKVLVHCIAGISRSSTALAAYLMKSRNLSVQDALDVIRKVRPIIVPNEGFMTQLQVYYDCQYSPSALKSAYRKWYTKRAQGVHLAPVEAQHLPKVLVPVSDSSIATSAQLRCKKCRLLLGTNTAIVYHEPLDKKIKFPSASSSILRPSCGQYFMEAVEWMQEELTKGSLEGKLFCPKCKSKVGTYRWQGMTCTCNAWVTPAFALQRGRIDEEKAG